MADYTRTQGSLRSHCIDMAPFPGALAVVCVRAMREMVNRPELDTDKPRPAVLSRMKPNGWWLAWGLTGNSTFQDGTPRMRAPGLDQCGLQPGYVWGGHVVQVPPEDVVGVVWAAPHELLLAVCQAEKGMPYPQACRIADQLHRDNVDNNWTWPKPATA